MLAFWAAVVRLSSEDSRASSLEGSREHPREGHPFDTQNTLDNTPPVAVVKEPEAGVAQETVAAGGSGLSM